MITFTIFGLPVGQPRPKATRRGAHAAVYTPDTADLWKAQVSALAKSYLGAPLSGPVSIRMDFTFTRPAGHLGKRGLKPSAPKWHAQKPDADNLAKSVLDCLGGIAFLDDKQVSMLVVSKAWGESSGLTLTIGERE